MPLIKPNQTDNQPENRKNNKMVARFWKAIYNSKNVGERSILSAIVRAQSWTSEGGAETLPHGPTRTIAVKRRNNMNIDDQENKTLDDLRVDIESLLTSNTFRQTLQNKQTELSDKTTEEYDSKMDLLRSVNQLPFQYCTERNLSKNAYRTLRAALKHYIVRELREALLLGTEEAMSRAIKKARLAIKDEEQFYEQRPDATKERRARESGRITKRKTLRGLPADWREQIYNYLLLKQKDGYALPALLVAMAGCRPGELVKGVRVSRNGPYIDIVIEGSKQSKINKSGQETRTLSYPVDSPEGQELAELILDDCDATIIKIPKADSFQKAYKKAAIAVLGKKGQRISPYSARHQFSADLKAAGHEVEDIAKGMGHQSCRSQWSYGRKQQAKGGGAIKINATTTPRFISDEKAEREHPKFVKDKKVDSAKIDDLDVSAVIFDDQDDDFAPR